jgi:hypothetical protein
LINVVSWHESNWGIEIFITFHTSLIFVSWLFWTNLGESAHNCF